MNNNTKRKYFHETRIKKKRKKTDLKPAYGLVTTKFLY